MKNFIIQSTDKFILYVMNHLLWSLDYYGRSSNSMIRIMFCWYLLCDWILNGTWLFIFLVWRTNHYPIFDLSTHPIDQIGGGWPLISFIPLDFMRISSLLTLFERVNSSSTHCWNAFEINESNFINNLMYS